MCFQIFHYVADRVDLLQVLRRDLNFELFLECHYHLK